MYQVQTNEKKNRLLVHKQTPDLHAELLRESATKIFTPRPMASGGDTKFLENHFPSIHLPVLLREWTVKIENV